MTTASTPAGTAPFEQLQAVLRGKVTTPDHPDYDEARKVYNAMITWADVDHATVGFGMATPSGFLSSTGVGGLTLGGGIGYLSRQFGLTIVGVDPDPANAEIISNGPATTGRHCTPHQPAAPTSTS